MIKFSKPEAEHELKVMIKYPYKKILVFLGKGHVKTIENELNINNYKEVL